MRDRSTPKKPSQPEPKKKPIQKDKSKPKFLKYKPAKGDENKQWKIEAIVNDRVTLKPAPNAPQSDSQNILAYQKIKEYEIAWVQNRKEGLWPNTWEPQQHIPEDTRLDYLLRKRYELNKKKSKSTDANIKTKESLESHIRFTMNKYKVGQRYESVEDRRRQAMKMMQKNSSEKSVQKKKKQVKYKDWFLSFSSKKPEYSKMIYRFMRLEKNEKQSNKQQPSNNSFRIQNIKKEFIESNPSLKDFNSKDDISELVQNSEKNSSKMPNHKDDGIPQHVPRDTCLQIFKEIGYAGQCNNMECFIVKLNDGSFAWIFEDDLIKYFPWIYEKLITQILDKELAQSIKTMQNLDVNNYSGGAKWLEEMSHQIGIPRNYFWELDKQFSRTNRFFRNQSLKNASNPNLNDVSFSSGNNNFMGTNKSQIHSSFDQNLNQTQLIKELQKLKIDKVFQVQQHFKALEKKCQQFEDLPIELSHQRKLFEPKYQIDGILNFISPKNIFPSDSELLNEWKTAKKQKQSQRLANTKKETKQSSVKFESSFERNSFHSPKKVQPTFESSQKDLKLQAKRKKETVKTESIQISEDTNKSAKTKKLSKIEKSPQKKVKLTNEQDEINEILGCMEETPTNRRKESFYDSEDESSKN